MIADINTSVECLFAEGIRIKKLISIIRSKTHMSMMERILLSVKSYQDKTVSLSSFVNKSGVDIHMSEPRWISHTVRSPMLRFILCPIQLRMSHCQARQIKALWLHTNLTVHNLALDQAWNISSIWIKITWTIFQGSKVVRFAKTNLLFNAIFKMAKTLSLKSKIGIKLLI